MSRPFASQPRESLMPLAVLGAVAATAGLTAYLARPARRPRTSARDHALISYLHDHLSASEVALPVVDRLVWAAQSREDATLFRRLFNEFDEDRAVVLTLLTGLGASGRPVKRGEPRDLSLLRTLEALAIGVQGKRCLWRTLQNLRTVPSTVLGMSFVELEAKAVRQWEAIEARRRALAALTFDGAAL